MDAKVLLLGNGINRLSNEYSWSDLLDELIKKTKTSEVITYKEEKPFTLLYLQKMGNYLKDKITSKRKGEQKEIRSPIQKAIHRQGGIRAFDKAKTIYSWVDLFLIKDVYILGLALDYTEIDLWWLMIFKERLKRETGFPYGNTTYYMFYPHTVDKMEEAKLSIIESFGVNVIKKDVGKSYVNAGDAYDVFINTFPTGG